jgi:hypothetical protein
MLRVKIAADESWRDRLPSRLLLGRLAEGEVRGRQAAASAPRRPLATSTRLWWTGLNTTAAYLLPGLLKPMRQFDKIDSYALDCVARFLGARHQKRRTLAHGRGLLFGRRPDLMPRRLSGTVRYSADPTTSPGYPQPPVLVRRHRLARRQVSPS